MLCISHGGISQPFPAFPFSHEVRKSESGLFVDNSPSGWQLGFSRITDVVVADTGSTHPP